MTPVMVLSRNARTRFGGLGTAGVSPTADSLDTYMNLTGAGLLAADAAVAIGRVTRHEELRVDERVLLNALVDVFRTYRKVVEGTASPSAVRGGSGEANLAPGFSSLARHALTVNHSSDRREASLSFEALATNLEAVLGADANHFDEDAARAAQGFFRSMSEDINRMLTTSGEDFSSLERGMFA